MFRSQTLIIATALVLVPLSSTVLASSDDAWGNSRKMLRPNARARRRADRGAEGGGRSLRHESYGVAILTGKAVGADATVSSICVYDKKSQTAEIGGELPADQVTISMP